MSAQQLVRVAAAQYPIEFLASWARFEDKIRRWVGEAAGAGARILLFPEYASMELASLFPQAVHADLHRQLEHMQELLPRYLDLLGRQAREHSVYLVAGSFPVRETEEFRNRAFFFSPTGRHEHQDKLIMTRFENERWIIKPGDQAKVFSTEFGRIAVNVCYDAEFPLIARHQAQAGARVILVPSCTDTLAGYHRVRIGCQARALENQCYVVQAPTVGEAAWSPAVDANVGAAGVFTPLDRGFPPDGVLALGELNAPQWVFADLALDAIECVRQGGQVLNYRDWTYQTALDTPVSVLPLL